MLKSIIFGVTPGAVSQWLKAVREQGLAALYSRKGERPKPRLSEAHLERLPELLAQGPEAYGFRGEVKAFLCQGGAKRLYLAQLPGYAPELNPDEGVWNYLKRVELKNLYCHDLFELGTELRKAVVRLRHKTNVIQGFIRQVYTDVAV